VPGIVEDAAGRLAETVGIAAARVVAGRLAVADPLLRCTFSELDIILGITTAIAAAATATTPSTMSAIPLLPPLLRGGSFGRGIQLVGGPPSSW
jgi:hypothetical protein